MVTCSPSKEDFFDSIIPIVRPLSIRLNIDENLLLTLVAFEDAWGQDAHNKVLHNIFGVTKAGGNNLKFVSYQDCAAFWERSYGDKVRGIRSLEPFIDAMKKIGYNSVNKKYYDQFRSVYHSVLAYKTACKVK